MDTHLSAHICVQPADSVLQGTGTNTWVMKEYIYIFFEVKPRQLDTFNKYII